jgi:hypothetical protein
MRIFIAFGFIISILAGCTSSKWELIYSDGIKLDNFSEEAIYFENSQKGVIGGYTLVKDSSADNDFKLSMLPVVYLTTDGGKKWHAVQINTILKGSVRALTLTNDTLLCLTDSGFFNSPEISKTLQLNKSEPFLASLIGSRYHWACKQRIDSFVHSGVVYKPKECYQTSKARVLVCRGPSVQTDYYFASFDNGRQWRLLETDFSGVSSKYLLADSFLLRYQYPLGLERLKLK